MTSLASGTAVFAALAVLVAALLYARLALVWRAAQDGGRLRLVAMLKRHDAPADQALGTGGQQAAIAMRRCMVCPGKRECDQWLASDAQGGIDAFCPNAEFIGRVANRH